MLPKSGTISMDMICAEFGVDPLGVELGSKALRDICGISSGDISLSDFYGLGATRDYYFWIKYTREPKYNDDYFGREYSIDTTDPYYKDVFGDIGISGQKRMNFGFSGINKIPMFHYEIYATFPSICSPNNMQWFNALDLINYGVTDGYGDTDGGVYVGTETYKKYDITVPQYNALVADADKWIPCSVKIPIDYFSSYNITLQRGAVVYPHPEDPNIVHPHAPVVPKEPSIFDAFDKELGEPIKGQNTADIIIRPVYDSTYSTGYVMDRWGSLVKVRVNGVEVPVLDNKIVLDIGAKKYELRNAMVYRSSPDNFFVTLGEVGTASNSTPYNNLLIQMLGYPKNTIKRYYVGRSGIGNELNRRAGDKELELGKGYFGFRITY